jgi:hypothetical protein
VRDHPTGPPPSHLGVLTQSKATGRLETGTSRGIAIVGQLSMPPPEPSRAITPSTCPIP